jgi:hypothetical protein
MASSSSLSVVRRELTGTSGGKGIKISSTNSGVEIHTHDSTFDQSQFDELHLWAYNSHSSSVTVTLQWGGTTSPDNLIPIALQPGSYLQIVCGQHIGGDLAVNAVASVADKIIVYGYALSHIRDVVTKENEYTEPQVVYYNGYSRHD